MNHTDSGWMQHALSRAKDAGEDVPVGAVVVLNNRIIGSAHNQREKTGDPTAHAEIIALRQAASATHSWRLSGATLFSTLEPCPMCAEAIIQARLARVVFGAYDPISGACGSRFNLFSSRQSLPVPEILAGILEEPCRELLVEFFAGQRINRGNQRSD